MKICSIEGCEKPVVAKGLCNTHYYRLRKGITDMRPERLPLTWKPDDPRYKNKSRTCSVEGCELPFYAKGLCRKHWAHHHRTGRTSPLPKKPKPICKVEGCNKRSITMGFCRLHYSRYHAGRPLDRPYGLKGKNNPNWKGGVFEYPNHYAMKKVRLEVLKEANYICEFCGGPADRVHHRDHSKDNHAKENLAASCHRCNLRMKKTKNIRFIHLYGKSVRKIREATGLSQNKVYHLHHSGELAMVVAYI